MHGSTNGVSSMDKLLLRCRFSNGRLDSEPNGIDRGQEDERQDRPDRSSAYKCVGERSPEDREGPAIGAKSDPMYRWKFPQRGHW
jgi:hypothetical protein